MTFSGSRLIRDYDGPSRKRKKMMDFLVEVNLESATAWVAANLADSGWIYLQNNDKKFTGKDDPKRTVDYDR